MGISSRCQRGQIVIAPFPFSVTAGSTASGALRPALVLATLEHDDVLLCQITGQTQVSRYALLVEDAGFTFGNLRGASFVRADKLFACASQPLRYIATLKPKPLAGVIAAIYQLLTD